ncbi:hypothetical protein C2G38_2106376 [Gigaspora rosea]|uniref:Uncharacterized protein n=1 Tax=Gigaspora rosea TaxID=44941 RepID=A0A397UJ67_9GLOM|nr:hypothetical protein C2G38_2106376 [Gigaspora rosea]
MASTARWLICCSWIIFFLKNSFLYHKTARKLTFLSRTQLGSLVNFLYTTKTVLKQYSSGTLNVNYIFSCEKLLAILGCMLIQDAHGH